MRGSGVTVDCTAALSDTFSCGSSSESLSATEQVVNRASINDVLLTTDHPLRSFLKISRGAGYAQYGGMPVIIESNYHISPEEYDRRRRQPWPSGEGAFVPNETFPSQAQPNPTNSANPQWSTEIIGDSQPGPASSDELQSINDLFQKFKQELPGDSNDQQGLKE